MKGTSMRGKPHDLSKFRREQNKKLSIKDGFFDPITWISTGNFALNKMISDQFDGGIPIGAVTGFAGESGCLPGTAKVRIRLRTGDKA
jgi:RecA/RadA recombinase